MYCYRNSDFIYSFLFSLHVDGMKALWDVSVGYQAQSHFLYELYDSSVNKDLIKFRRSRMRTMVTLQTRS